MFEIPKSMVDEVAVVLGRWLLLHGVINEGDTVTLERVADKLTVKTGSGLSVELTDSELMTSHTPLPALIAEKLKACSPNS